MNSVRWDFGINILAIDSEDHEGVWRDDDGGIQGFSQPAVRASFVHFNCYLKSRNQKTNLEFRKQRLESKNSKHKLPWWIIKKRLMGISMEFFTIVLLSCLVCRMKLIKLLVIITFSGWSKGLKCLLVVELTVFLWFQYFSSFSNSLEQEIQQDTPFK